MLRDTKLKIFLASCAALCSGVFQFSLPISAQQPIANSEVVVDQESLQRPEILKRQARLARQYELLEEKLFTLYGFERDKNPTRSKLLEKAFKRSQASATNDQLQEVVALIESAKLPRAQEQQEEVVEKLKDLLALLQSEDRSMRLKDEIERYQEYLKEVEKLLRLQKGLRGQTEGGIDAQRIAKSESQAAERAGNLSDQIKQNEEQVETEEDLQDVGQPEQDDAVAEQERSDSGNESDQDNDSSDVQTEPKESGEGTEDDSSEQQGSSKQQRDVSEQGRGESEQSLQSEEELVQSDGPVESPAPPANPIRERIDSAQERMKEAQKK